MLTDVHEAAQCARVAQAVDVLQIPAFLCRQTDLLVAAAETGRAVNVKKGQFLAPWDMANVVAKITGAGNANVLVTERGASFGYNTLVSDMRALPVLAQTGAPVIFDATHSVQQPGGQGTSSGGQREFVPVLARAAVAVGVAGVFIETHQDPDKAPSDGPNMIPIKELEALLQTLIQFDRVAKAARRRLTPHTRPRICDTVRCSAHGGDTWCCNRSQGCLHSLIYFIVAAVLVAAYLYVYTWVTAHDEFALLRANNPSAAIALGLSMIGFALPLTSSIGHADGVLDMTIWGVIALIVQIGVYYAGAAWRCPNLSQAHRGGRDRARDLARRGLGRGRHAQCRLDGHVTPDETLRPSRIGADGRDRRDRGRRLHDAGALGRMPAASRRPRRPPRRFRAQRRARRKSRAGVAARGAAGTGDRARIRTTARARNSTDRAIDRVPLQPVERHAQHVDRHVQPAAVHQHVRFARRIRLHRRPVTRARADMLNARLAASRNFRSAA